MIRTLQFGNGTMTVHSPNFSTDGCHDFEQCARKYTSFDHETNGGQQEHHNFMTGRTFRIMFVKNGVWLHGKVVHWVEHSFAMGFADTTLRWILVADLEAASSVSVGAIVTSKDEDEHMQESDSDSDKSVGDDNHDFSIVTGVSPDGETCQLATFKNKKATEVKKASLEPIDVGLMGLSIHRVNVQGGGTVSARHTVYLRRFKLPANLISFEWTSPFLDESYHLPAPDTFPLTVSSAMENEELLRRKMDLIEQLRSQVEQLSAMSEKMDACVRLYFFGLQENLGDAEALRKELMCLPFVLYGVFLRNLIRTGALSSDDVNSAVTMIVMALRQAEEDKNYQDEFAFLTEILSHSYPVPQGVSPVEVMDQLFYLSLYGVLSPIGEWFEMKREDYRTATWCYNEAQKVVHRAPFPLGGADTHANLIFTDTMNAGVAYRRMSDYLSAAKYYAKAFEQPPPTTKNHSDLVVNARKMQDTAPDWVGTSGYFTPWETGHVNNEPAGDCASCGTADARSKCGNCKLVRYCNATCQKAHWKTVHQYTCLFKKVKNS